MRAVILGFLLLSPVFVLPCGSYLWPDAKNIDGTHKEIVRVKSLGDQDGSRVRRSTSPLLPESLVIQFHKGGQPVTLKLTRNHHVDPNVPVFIQRGRSLNSQNLSKSQNISFYQDLDQNAFVAVQGQSNNSQVVYQLTGFFSIDGEDFMIFPHELRTRQQHAEFSSDSHVVFKPAHDLSIFSDIALPVKLENKKTHNRDSRKKRSIQHSSIEVLVCVDFPIYERWLNWNTGPTSVRDWAAKNAIRQFFSLVLNGIDLRYQSLFHGSQNLRIEFSGIFIADTPSSSFWTFSNKWSSLPRERVNVRAAVDEFDRWLTSRPDLPSFDHALLFSGYDLTLASAFEEDPSIENMMCPSGNCSIIEDHLEFGLSSERNDKCFLSADEMLDSAAMSVILRYAPESMYNPDLTCRMFLGDGSFVCRNRYQGDYSHMCRALWCAIPGSKECDVISPGDGFPCGEEKWCINGKCQYFSDSTTFSGNCPLGDTPGEIWGGMNCSQIVQQDHRNCYGEYIQQTCCGSCEALNTGIQGCEYGDKELYCRMLGRGECYFFDFSCCATCHKMRNTNDTGCEYGDHVPGCQRDKCSSYVYLDRQSCCDTCRAETAASTPPSVDEGDASTPRTVTVNDTMKTTEATTTTSRTDTMTGTAASQSTNPTTQSPGLTTADGNDVDPTRDSSGSVSLRTVTFVTTTESIAGGSGAQGGNTNTELAVGLGVAVGVVALVLIIATIVHFVRKRLQSSDSVSLSGEGSALSVGSMRGARMWHPDYNSTDNVDLENPDGSVRMSNPIFSADDD